MKGEYFFNEFIFWLLFISFNALHYAVNYIINFKQSHFLPYISEFIKSRKLGLIANSNQDAFRYSVELSLVLLLSRITHMSAWTSVFSTYYVIILLFNLYQYLLRVIYQSEPNLYNDLRLLKNGWAIVWHESKWKVMFAIACIIGSIIGFNQAFYHFFNFSALHKPSIGFFVISGLWVLTVLRKIQMKGFYTAYPNDLYSRYHFSVIEIAENIKRSIVTHSMSKKKLGNQYFKSRETLKFEPKTIFPNIHIFFVESYGSFYYLDSQLKEYAFKKSSAFIESITTNGWRTTSNFSQSPVTGGQSWLAYSSMLYGLKMSDNTVFENYLHDKNFREANSLFGLLKKSGYTNYHLNPISPIKGINVPYKELREFYSIDNWILKDKLNYKGEVYGWGESPPDQYAMNYTMELIKSENPGPYTFFYITKNSHSPFIPPKLVNDWKSLNKHQNGNHHIHKGFLKHPTKEDYSNAITYQFDNISRFILDYGNGDDIFLLMGDHQPPMLSNPVEHGLYTPVHVISRNLDFISYFERFGFNNSLKNCESFVKHEAMYSIFLRSLMTTFGHETSIMPDYEPNGIQLS